MKQLTLEQLLIATAPQPGDVNAAFSDAVMSRIRQASPTSALTKNISTHRPPKQKRGLLFRLRHLPKVTLLLLAVAALITATGTAYAIYTLWPKPVIHTQPSSKNQFGRTQIIASLENCSDQAKKSTFEIKKGSTLDPSELPQVLQARCEQKEIEKWAKDNKLTSDGLDQLKRRSNGVTKEGDIENWGQVSSVASKIVSITPTTLSLTGDIYNSPKEPLVLTPETKFIVGGNEAKREAIKPGDAVLFIKWDRYQYKLKSTPVQEKPVLLGETIESKLTYVIKVDLPFEYYGPTKQNQIIERESCDGNPEDTCLNGGNVDLYENFKVSAHKGEKIVSGEIVTRRLQAVIQSHSGTVITVKTSSGRVFTLTLPSDILTTFNRTRSAEYNGVTIGVGDTLDLSYEEKAAEHATSLGPDHLTDVNFATDFIQKSDPLKKY